MKNPFQPNNGASTVRLAVTTTTGSIALPLQSPSSAVRIVNTGDETAYIAFGGDTIEATVPVAGGAAGSLPIHGNGGTEVMQCYGTYIAAITASGTADLYATIGEGY